jgi:ADP-ribosyl-[dinitrogen reductase] hydrolase
MAKLLLEGESKEKAYTILQQSIPKFLESKSIEADEISLYKRLLLEDISLLEEDAIRSYGYVVDTLEASLWCFLTTDNYRDCVLKAANLGHDTDTVAAIAGGMSAIYYGFESIPKEWTGQMVKKDKIDGLVEKLEKFMHYE